jgi:hypothetical protein
VLGAIIAEIFADEISPWITWGSLTLALFGFAVTRMRMLANAIGLGQAGDSLEMQSQLARSVFRDHLPLCRTLALQLGRSRTQRALPALS